MIQRHLRQVWEQLRAQAPQRKDELHSVSIKGLRGIQDLTVEFRYPVCVLAGPNACGKSTVLFALACAYRPPHAGPRDFVPSTLFPDFKPSRRGQDLPTDPKEDVEIAFSYKVNGAMQTMRWRRKKSWNRSGLKSPPVRPVYLRTLANLSNPSEVRSLLQLGRREVDSRPVDAADITLAHRILPWKYRQIVRIASKNKELLFADRHEGFAYSEFHMSSGERAILHLSLDLARLHNALVLIDEVEAGLHPFTQQLLLLELQRLALRNQLQIIVATHSPVVLDSVPPEARIFLERTDNNVIVRPAYHDVIQRAFYGQALDRLSVVCEDAAAEAVIRGIFDALLPSLELMPSDVEIGRNTSKHEFRHHITAFARFGKLWSTLFVLDGDARDLLPELQAIASQHGQNAHIICLPGNAAPEVWAWRMLEEHQEDYAKELGMDSRRFAQALQEIFRIYEGAADTESNKAKGRLVQLAEQTGRDVESILRLIGRREAERNSGEIKEVVDSIKDAIAAWRHMRGDM